jgi:hypothetical protein
MQIAPINSIAINGRHCPAGEPVEVPEKLGLELIVQGIARRIAVMPVAAAALDRALAESGPETAALAPATEQAVARPAAKPKRASLNAKPAA